MEENIFKLEKSLGKPRTALKKNSYLASIFSDRQFELARRCLQSKQKELKKAGRGNKEIKEIDVLYEKNLLGLSSGEALLKYSLA